MVSPGDIGREFRMAEFVRITALVAIILGTLWAFGLLHTH
jgi:hypothetical protein